MRGRPSVWTRTRRVEVALDEVEAVRLAGRAAAELGLEAEVLLADARAFARRCAAVGARTRAARHALVARELGLSPAELAAEVAPLTERWA